MRLSTLLRAVASVAAIGIGLAWALPATAIGITAGLTLVLAGGGIALRGLRWIFQTMLQPGASEEERAQPLVPRVVGTAWIVLLAGACAVVAYESEHGAIGDAHGYAFIPLMLPWFLLTVGVAYGPLVSEPLSRDDLLPDLDL